MVRLRQKFPREAPPDLAATLAAAFARPELRERLTPGARIALAVGSRGITGIAALTRAVIERVRARGAVPFIVPAMGSHGGATEAGQAAILAEYGVTAETLGVPLDASMAVTRLDRTAEGIDVFSSSAALAADGILLINRVKPHTDFGGDLGSGLVKMSVVGLGKREGAVAFHAAAARLGHAEALRSLAAVTLARQPLLGGVAIVEGFHHETARLRVFARDEILAGERALLTEAALLLPRLPFDDIDLLIVDRLGKDISGTGMDPNVTGRYVHGYLSSLGRAEGKGPTVRRLFVRDLTPGAHGNAIGIGMADFTTTRLVRALRPEATYTNALTALSVQAAKIPIHFDTDCEVLDRALASLGLADPRQARVVRIRDTLSLAEVDVSEACLDLARGQADLEVLGEPAALRWDAEGNLAPFMAFSTPGA